MNWNVTIDFKRGPSFGTTAQALDKDSAIALAMSVARNCGFDQQVKKAVAVLAP